MTPAPRFLRPCLDCGTLSRNSRCDKHEAERKAKAPRRPDSPERIARKRNLYDSSYRKQSKLIRENAITCHLCGQGAIPGDPWQADHVDPGNKFSILLPAHRSCNLRKGGNRPTR